MKMKLFLWVVLFTATTSFAQQINPGDDEIFRPTELSVINLTLTPEDKAFLLNPDNAYSDVYFPAQFQMINSQMDTTLIAPVGIRLRGNTSRQHEKKAYKIDFREYDGEKFFGYKKFNLKSDVNDPTMMRELLTFLCYREMEVPAARVHMVKLYMNEEYMGAYLNVEQIDDEFLDSRFGHEEGFLYKCAWGANLLSNGQVFDTEVFESEINQELDTRAELHHFVEVLNTTSSSNFVTEIEKVFDVDRYIRQLAVEAMLGHWDAYSYNKNNFYLFYNGQTKLVEFIPYDTDNTWGIDWVGKDWAVRDLNQWYTSGDPRPLTTRILSVSAYKHKYNQYLRELMEKYFNEDYLLPLFNAHKVLMADAVEEDTYYPRAFGFTYDDFLTSFSTGMSNNHVKYGLEEYLEVRTAKAIEQIPYLITDVQREIENRIVLYPNPSLQPVFYVISNTATSANPMVYSSTGVSIESIVERREDEMTIRLASSTTKGLYFVRVGEQVIKWVLQ